MHAIRGDKSVLSSYPPTVKAGSEKGWHNIGHIGERKSEEEKIKEPWKIWVCEGIVELVLVVIRRNKNVRSYGCLVRSTASIQCEVRVYLPASILWGKCRVIILRGVESNPNSLSYPTYPFTLNFVFDLPIVVPNLWYVQHGKLRVIDGETPAVYAILWPGYSNNKTQDRRRKSPLKSHFLAVPTTL